MTAGSWAYMLLVWSVITAINVFCFVRIFRKKSR
jgi:hypothetical protein